MRSISTLGHVLGHARSLGCLPSNLGCFGFARGGGDLRRIMLRPMNRRAGSGKRKTAAQL